MVQKCHSESKGICIIVANDLGSRPGRVASERGTALNAVDTPVCGPARRGGGGHVEKVGEEPWRRKFAMLVEVSVVWPCERLESKRPFQDCGNNS
jgi:hypothetical protein